MKTYIVSCSINHRNFEHIVPARSGADAIAAARAAYGPDLTVFSVRLAS